MQEHSLPSSNVIAAIDVGTNSFHMVVATVSQRGVLQALARQNAMVRLGMAAGDMKVLTPEAMSRGLDTLKLFATEARAHNAHIRAVATSAVREAANRDEFVKKVHDLTVIENEVVSGEEEGRLIYIGAMHALPLYASRSLVLDIGGGSTESIYGFQGKALSVQSAKLGHIRLSQRFFPKGMGTKKSVEECRQAIRGVWAPMFHERVAEGFDVLVGCSGTITAIAAMTLARQGKRLPENFNGLQFQSAEILETISTVVEARTGNKAKQLSGLEPKRADVILAGALILEQALLGLRASAITISSYALREGIVFDTLQQEDDNRTYHHLSHLRYQSVEHMCDLYRVRRNHAEHVRNLSLQLFDALAPLHGYADKEREMLEAASLLHDVGYHIAADQHHKHSEYIIRNSPMLGFTNDESEVIASIARYHRKSHPKKKHPYYNSLTPNEQKVVSMMSAILRITEGLDRQQLQLIHTIATTISADELDITLHSKSAELETELWGAERRKLLLEQILQKNVRFIVATAE